MNTPAYTLAAAGLFALTLAFGFWLSRVGKPYHPALFNVHKLAALGAVVLAVLQLVKNPNLLSSFSLAAVGLGLAAFAVLALFVSGALMSAGKLEHTALLAVHRAALAALALGCGLALTWFKVER